MQMLIFFSCPPLIVLVFVLFFLEKEIANTFEKKENNRKKNMQQLASQGNLLENMSSFLGVEDIYNFKLVNRFCHQLEQSRPMLCNSLISLFSHVEKSVFHILCLLKSSPIGTRAWKEGWQSQNPILQELTCFWYYINEPPTRPRMRRRTVLHVYCQLPNFTNFIVAWKQVLTDATRMHIPEIYSQPFRRLQFWMFQTGFGFYALSRTLNFTMVQCQQCTLHVPEHYMQNKRQCESCHYFEAKNELTPDPKYSKAMPSSINKGDHDSPMNVSK
jgi:hypothetical protein